MHATVWVKAGMQNMNKKRLEMLFTTLSCCRWTHWAGFGKTFICGLDSTTATSAVGRHSFMWLGRLSPTTTASVNPKSSNVKSMLSFFSFVCSLFFSTIFGFSDPYITSLGPIGALDCSKFLLPFISIPELWPAVGGVDLPTEFDLTTICFLSADWMITSAMAAAVIHCAGADDDGLFGK